MNLSILEIVLYSIIGGFVLIYGTITTIQIIKGKKKKSKKQKDEEENE